MSPKGSLASSRVKSAPTPVGEPNVRAEAEKTIYTKKELATTVQSTGVPQGRRGNNIYMEQDSRKDESRASYRTEFLATVSELAKALYLQNSSSLMSEVCCGRPREGYVGSGFHASVLVTQRSAGKFAMYEAKFEY